MRLYLSHLIAPNHILMFHHRVISQCHLQEKLEKLDLQSFGKVAQLLITKLCNRRVTPRELIQCYPIVVLWMEQMQVSDNVHKTSYQIHEEVELQREVDHEEYRIPPVD